MKNGKSNPGDPRPAPVSPATSRETPSRNPGSEKLRPWPTDVEEQYRVPDPRRTGTLPLPRDSATIGDEGGGRTL